MTTIFSKILNGEVPASFVYRDEKVAAFMDVQPINPGHVLVIPNAEVTSLAELDEETGAHLFRIGHRIAKALRESNLKCEGVNLWLADGEAAQQDIFHVHLHVFPRFRGDNCAWQFGKDYYNLPAREELDRAAETLRAIIERLD